MKKIYTFDLIGMNGTVTMFNDTSCFTSKELAEKTRKAVMEANKDVNFPKCYCTDVKESRLFETEEEVPILNNK